MTIASHGLASIWQRAHITYAQIGGTNGKKQTNVTIQCKNKAKAHAAVGGSRSTADKLLISKPFPPHFVAPRRHKFAYTFTLATNRREET